MLCISRSTDAGDSETWDPTEPTGPVTEQEVLLVLAGPLLRGGVLEEVQPDTCAALHHYPGLDPTAVYWGRCEGRHESGPKGETMSEAVRNFPERYCE